MDSFIPEKIRILADCKSYTVDSIGQSGSEIRIYKDMVLKIEKLSPGTENAVKMNRWFQGKLPVPKILCYETADGTSFLLTERCKGESLCSSSFLKDPKTLVKLLAQGLKMLWELDVSDCPSCIGGLDSKLEIAKVNVENDLVDINNVEPETFGDGGFKDPSHLLEWLCKNRPEEELAVTHGDFCLPNVFAENGRITGFIDLGWSGAADKWQDIALCWRSLKHNFDGRYGCLCKDFDPDMIFDELGVEPNREKLRYYILLDELF